jgi:hypothetical protein
MARPVGGRLSEAFRDTYRAAELTQTQVAQGLEKRGWPTFDQPKVSKWLRGMERIPLDVLPDLDAICGVPLGTILRRAGYVADDTASLPELIRASPLLDKDERRVMLGIYELARKRSVSATR